MGKEWLYWAGSNRGAGGGGSGRRSSGYTDRMPKEMKDAATSAGCMCAVFQLFHLHHFQSSLNQEPTTSKGKYIHTGLEAPRNSLELEFNEPPPTATNTSPMTSPAMDNEEEEEEEEEEEGLNFPLGKFQIKTSRSEISSSTTPRASTCANSPAGTKTPGLVARLMGLDLLPECASPSTPSGPRIKSRLHVNGTRSLPETPRVSSARKSDAECHKRLSLQINDKENVIGEFENISSGHSAKHFVKQVGDRVSRGRAFGLDVTNNYADSRNREQQYVRRDENLITVKPTKNKNDPIKILSRFKGEITTCSSKVLNSENHHRTRVIIPLQRQKQQFKDRNKVEDRERCNSSRYKNKKYLSPPPTKLTLKQSQVSDAFSSKRSTKLSSKPSHSYKQVQASNIFTAPKSAVQPDSANGCAASLPGGAWTEYGSYIRKILKFAGSISKPNTGSQSIDPLIFHTLELFQTNTNSVTSGRRNTVLSHRCNRRLIFQLVDELLTDISRTHFNSTPWVSPTGGRGGCGSPLVDELCKRIDSFPAANCVVLEEVDSLIGRDLRGSRLNGFSAEEENVACEIEDEIVELLLRETAAMMGGRAAEWRKQVADATW